MIVDLSVPPTQQLLGDCVGISQPAVSGWYSEGRIPAGATLGEALRIMFHTLREQAAGRMGSEVGGLDLAQERAALAREQRLGLEIKNAVLRQEYAPIALLAEVLATASQAVAERFDHLPGTIKKACPSVSEQDRDQILMIVASARNEWVRQTAKLVATSIAGTEDAEPELDLGDTDEPRAD
jgi:phage terminase Nu1 subunit (DNA packaging protein)